MQRPRCRVDNKTKADHVTLVHSPDDCGSLLCGDFLDRLGGVVK
jgi:hypothetical protein